MLHAMQRRQVCIVQSVPRIHLQPERVRLVRAGNQPRQFVLSLNRSSRRESALTLFPGRMSRLTSAATNSELFRKRAGVQFHKLAAGARTGFDLLFIWRDRKSVV